MTGGVDLYYGDLPYLYPLVDSQPVVRIPVAGPAPYNTLAVVRGAAWGQSFYSDGNVHRYTSATSTNFHLAEYDERVGTPPPQHSTAVCLQLAEITTDCEFLFADDTVTGFFDPMGVWTVQIDQAIEADDEALGAARFYYSSWVLCYEPPVRSMPPGGPWRASGREAPNLGYLVPTPSPGDRSHAPVPRR